MYKIKKYLNAVSTEITVTIFTKFVEPSVKGILNICIIGHTSMTKMAAIPIDDENDWKIIFKIKKTVKLGLCIELCEWEIF